jgi:hypothetical protein
MQARKIMELHVVRLVEESQSFMFAKAGLSYAFFWVIPRHL